MSARQWIPALFILVVLLAGCASSGLSDAQVRDRLKADAERGMTYDEALTRWGQPSGVTQGTDIFIATWRRNSSGTLLMPGVFDSYYAVPIEHGYELLITFDKKTNIMLNGKYRSW